MLLVFLIVVPLILGAINFSIKGAGAKQFALVSSLVTLILALIASCNFLQGDVLQYQANWISSLGATLSFSTGSMSILMVLLTAIVFFITILAQQNKPLEEEHRFYGLIQLAQAGLMGVFLANDLLLFYFFWELALIPIYFLSSQWGGEKRVKITFKFFVYTFLGSLILLAGIIYLYLLTPNQTFDINTIIATGKSLPEQTQIILFVMFFIAFAIKMPIFPFHTWQPDAYEQSLTPITIVLSALMVKMGLYAVAKWILPVFPSGVSYWSDTVIILALIGLVYGSLVAIVQTDIKRLIAYSSIAHIALMCIGLFVDTKAAYDGLIIQMFNHGINIAGMWLIVNMIETRYGTRDLRQLGGMASAAPYMTIALVIIAFANIALPLTNGFIGEFMLFHGIFSSSNPNHIIYMVVAGLGIILGAIYTLNMVQKVAYGPKETVVSDMSKSEWISMIIVVALIIGIGVYPTLVYQFIY